MAVEKAPGASRKSAAKKSSAGKSGAKKSSAATTSSKKGAAKRSAAPKYGPTAGEKVERSMHEMERGTLKSGRSGKKVTDPKQAIAIGLSEARRAGGKVPPSPSSKKRS